MNVDELENAKRAEALARFRQWRKMLIANYLIFGINVVLAGVHIVGVNFLALVHVVIAVVYWYVCGTARRYCMAFRKIYEGKQ
jgi:hypothetical protein